jgi:hypothetical protein
MRTSLVSLAFGSIVLASSGVASADPSCVLTASPALPKNTTMFTGATGSDAIATLTGQSLVITATLGAGRARVRTGGGFRIEGFVEAPLIPLFLTKNVALVEGTVWLGGGRPVTQVGVKNDQIEVELRAGAPIDQTLRAPAPCASLAMDAPSFKHPSPPGDARVWRTKSVPLGIAKEPGKDAVFRFTSASAANKLTFFGTERRDAMVHVLLLGDVVVDGWANAADLEALPEGEIQDAPTSPRVTSQSASISLGGNPTKARPSKEVAIMGRASGGLEKIGTIEAGTEVLVLDTVAGWATVLPASLALMPADGRPFLAKADDLK